MKSILKNKWLQICTLLICAVFGLLNIGYVMRTSGTDDIKLSIKYNNLAFQDSVYILYAVDSKGIDRKQDIKVLVWDEPQSEYVYGSQDHTLLYDRMMTINGQDYPTFILDYLSAKQMADTIYTVAYYDGTYSAPNKYSILQYAKNKMDTTENPALHDLLVSMLDYGAKAQKYFNYKMDRLADDTYYNVLLENGVFDDGFARDLVKNGERVVVTADAKAGHEFSYWEDENHKIVSLQAKFEYIAKSDITLRAVYDTPITLDNIFTFSYSTENDVTTVKLSIKGNVGICGFEGAIGFNCEGAEYANAQFNNNGGMLDGGCEKTANASEVKLIFYNSNIETMTSEFEVMELTFNNTAEKAAIMFNVSVDVIVDGDFNTVSYTVANDTFIR